MSNQMDVVNKTLLLSLHQEVKTINETVKKIPVAKDAEEVKSWLFPSKPHDFVNELVCNGDIFQLESFKTYLELIIDRLYVGTRLILNYVEEKRQGKFEDNRFIHKPKLITLGLTFERLWNAVSVITSQEMSVKVTMKTTTGEDSCISEVFHKGSQTNIISLNKCDSCASAMLCMKNLLHSFKNNEFKMPFNERQLLRPKIFDITQFGCMLQTTSSLEKALNSLYEKLFSKEQETERLHNENQQLKSHVMEECGKIAFLQKEHDILKQKIEKDSLHITLLSNKNEELFKIKNKQDCQIKLLTETANNLNKSTKVCYEKIFKLASEKANLSSVYKRMMQNQIQIVKSSTLLQSRLTVIEDTHSSMKNSFKLLEEIVDNISRKLFRVSDILASVDAKIGKLNEQDEGVALLKSVLQQFKKVRCERKDTIHTDWKTTKSNTFQIKGNPVEDITRQMEENRVAIKKLEDENIKLTCVISKLTSLKR